MNLYEKCKTCRNKWHLSHSTADEMYNPCEHCCYEPWKLLESGELHGQDNYEQEVNHE